MAAPEPIGAHLPDGREPGPQSRRAGAATGVSRMLLPAMAVLFIACFIGIPLVIATVTVAPVVKYTVLGALTIVFLVAMYVLVRRFRPAEAGPFEVLADPLELRRGEEVEAELTIYDIERLDGRLEVGLVCVERYDRPTAAGGDSAELRRETEEQVTYERWLPAWRTEEPQSFAFRVPTDGPYSYEGECLSFAWRVAAREPDRDTAGDGSGDPIWVLP